MSRRMIACCRTAIAFLLAATATTSAVLATPYQVLHSLPLDAGYPNGDLAVIGSTIYGTGGDAIFSIGTNGSGFTIVHQFGQTSGDGGYPASGLSEVGSTLYGTTAGGGVGSNGTVYSLDTSNMNYQVLNSLANISTSPSSVPLKNPYAPPVIHNSTIFGTGSNGGTNFGLDGFGGVFKMDTSGANPQVLHAFDGTSSDGGHPQKALTLSSDGQNVYGVTFGNENRDSGPARYGVIFKINADGTGYQPLHGFNGSAPPNDGGYASRLVLVGTKLIGTTATGGLGFTGTMFSLDVNTWQFDTLFSFPDQNNDAPTLTLAGNKLVGTTDQGGEFGYGTVFEINPDGNGFQVLHEFEGGPDDGGLPAPGLTVVGSKIYGATRIGGVDDAGTLFVLDVPGLPEPSSIVLAIGCFGLFVLVAWRKRSRNR